MTKKEKITDWRKDVKDDANMRTKQLIDKAAAEHTPHPTPDQKCLTIQVRVINGQVTAGMEPLNLTQLELEAFKMMCMQIILGHNTLLRAEPPPQPAIVRTPGLVLPS